MQQPSEKKEQGSEEPIFSLAWECDDLIHQCVKAFELDGIAIKSLFEDYGRRFRAWSEHLGVFSGSQSNLDRRLSSAPETQDIMLRFLRILRRNLAHCADKPADQSRPVNSNMQIHHNFDILAIPLEYIDEALTELVHLGTAIRKSAKTTETARAQKFVAMYRDQEIADFEVVTLLAVETLYPNAPETLQQQLSRSMIDRYSRILYRARRNDILKRDVRIEKRDPSSQHASMEDDNLIHNQEKNILDQNYTRGASAIGRKRKPPAPTLTSFDQSKFKNTHRPNSQSGGTTVILKNTHEPPLPNFNGENLVKCRWCFTDIPQSFVERGSWSTSGRKHYCADLEPFPCLSEDCIDVLPSFLSIREWKDHMISHGPLWTQTIHKQPIWKCSLDGHAGDRLFYTIDHFYGHLKCMHADSADQALQEVQTPIVEYTRPSNVCPLCYFVPAGMNVYERSSHISQHGSSPIKSLKHHSSSAGKSRAMFKKNLRFDEPRESRDARSRSSEEIDGSHFESQEESAELTYVSAAMETHIAIHLQHLMALSLKLIDNQTADSNSEIRSLSTRPGYGSRVNGDSDWEIGDMPLSQFESTPSGSRAASPMGSDAATKFGEALVDWTAIQETNRSQQQTDNQNDPVLDKFRRFSMGRTNHSKTFRLRGIPMEYETRNEVCSLVQKTLALEPNASPTVYSLARSPTDPNSKIATLSFPSIPDSLSDRYEDEWSFNLSEDKDFDFDRPLVFDTHFTGFTPFHRASDRECHIDVIAVCGPGGHALGSFQERNGRFVWLRDALPTDIPNTRILTYGYNTELTGSESSQDLIDWGRILHLRLQDIREPNQPRSILFIGHSLGGLVIKETVRILERELVNAIAGFAFFGVPHLGLAVECLVPLVKDNPSRALLESLNKSSPFLEHLKKDFDKISEAKTLSVVSFYETEMSPTAAWANDRWEMSGPNEVLVEVLSATSGCQKQHPINRNHSEMVKYTGVHDQLYRRVLVALRPLLDISRRRIDNRSIAGGPREFVQVSSDERECLRSLSFPEQEHRYSEISYANDTCDWLLEDHQYQTWMNTSRGLFWIRGSPGTGKSVLTKFAVDAISRRKSGEIIASFFIHGRGTPLQRTPLGIFRALLNSLLISFPTYLAELTEVFEDKQKRYGSYEQKNGWQWNEKELETFLSRILVEGTKHLSVAIFIDALDECGDESAKRLLVYLKSLVEKAEHEGSLVRICFSSRHFPILGHMTMPNICVEQRNDRDIRLVVERRLKDVKPDGKRQKIEDEISLKSHGVFQWAVVITNMVLDEDAAGARTVDLLRLMSTIPPDLKNLYEHIFQGIRTNEHKQMVKLFQWVIFTKRPLSAPELREALATDKDMAFKTISQLRSQEIWSDDVSRFEMRVRHISRGLIEFRDRDVYEQYEAGCEEWNREAQFIHQSAEDFVNEKFLTNVDAESTTASRRGRGHFEISRSFLKYLTLEEVLRGDSLSLNQLSVTFPLLSYGVAFLLEHITNVEEEGIPQTDLLALIQWDRPERLKMLANIWRIMDPQSAHMPRGWPFVGATVLHPVIAFGSASLLDVFLRKDESELVGQDSEGNTPLHLALRENNENLALMILDRSRTWQTEQDAVPPPSSTEAISMERKDYLAHINATNHDNETPLALALSVRAKKAIRNLIDAGAEVKNEKSLVFYAISTKDTALLSRLIETGADLAGAVFFTVQCLLREIGHEDILYESLKSLLQAGADTRRFVGSEIEGYDEADGSDDDDFDRDQEAIFLASRSGRPQEISLLLSYGSSVTLRNNADCIPLWIAIGNGNLETARLLLRASPQTVEWPNTHGQTALDIAIELGNVDAVRLLIQEGGGRVTSKQALDKAILMNKPEIVEDLSQAYRHAT